MCVYMYIEDIRAKCGLVRAFVGHLYVVISAGFGCVCVCACVMRLGSGSEYRCYRLLDSL